MEHLHHLLFVTKKQDTSIFARHALNLGDDRVNDRGFVRIVRATSTAFPATSIQAVCLEGAQWGLGKGGLSLSIYLVNNQDLANGRIQDSLGVLFRFSEYTSHKICRVLYYDWDHKVRNWTLIFGMGRVLYLLHC